MPEQKNQGKTNPSASKPQVPTKTQKETSETTPKLGSLWTYLTRFGSSDTVMRIVSGVVLTALVVVVIWVMSNYYLRGEKIDFTQPTYMAPVIPTDSPLFSPPVYGGASSKDGISRLAMLHTILPNRPRFDVIQYIVQKGDTVFGIAEKFNLSPSTILWGNYFALYDDPHYLKPGQSLNILPVDGVYYQWNVGDGLNGVAHNLGVTPEDIINFPGNHLVAENIGDYAHPNIADSTWLIIPGGHRDFITWTGVRVTRSDPAVATKYGPGFCGTVVDGAVGTGNFIWPTVQHYLSGYIFSPESNHYGIDIGGAVGQPLYAADNGVIVYAGWNDHGYGNMVIIDHGGWQTLYAHLQFVNVACGASVFQGDVIGWMGMTGNTSGPHLHFEMISDTYGRVDPSQFLPPP
jgi:hypothetical protein